MRNTLLSFFVVAIVFVLYLAMRTSSTNTQNIYTEKVSGLSFEIPKGYSILTENTDNSNRYRKNIVLVTDEDKLEMDSFVDLSTEAPPSISISVYGNQGTGLSLVDWVNTSSESNFALSDGSSVSSKVDGKEAITYEWDGLYRGRTTAVMSGNYITTVSVTFFENKDSITKSARELIDSIKLNTPKNN